MYCCTAVMLVAANMHYCQNSIICWAHRHWINTLAPVERCLGGVPQFLCVSVCVCWQVWDHSRWAEAFKVTQNQWLALQGLYVMLVEYVCGCLYQCFSITIITSVVFHFVSSSSSILSSLAFAFPHLTAICVAMVMYRSQVVWPVLVMRSLRLVCVCVCLHYIYLEQPVCLLSEGKNNLKLSFKIT